MSDADEWNYNSPEDKPGKMTGAVNWGQGKSSRVTGDGPLGTGVQHEDGSASIWSESRGWIADVCIKEPKPVQMEAFSQKYLIQPPASFPDGGGDGGLGAALLGKFVDFFFVRGTNHLPFWREKESLGWFLASTAICVASTGLLAAASGLFLPSWAFWMTLIASMAFFWHHLAPFGWTAALYYLAKFGLLLGSMGLELFNIPNSLLNHHASTVAGAVAALFLVSNLLSPKYGPTGPIAGLRNAWSTFRQNAG